MTGNNARSFVIIATVVVLVAMVAFLRRPPPPESSKADDPSATAIANTRATGAAEEAALLPRMVDLGADKCIPCKKMAPILAELKVEYAGKAVIEFIDVWKNPEAGKPYEIRVIPTQVFFDREGREVWRHEGFLAKDEIIIKLKELGAG